MCVCVCVCVVCVRVRVCLEEVHVTHIHKMFTNKLFALNIILEMERLELPATIREEKHTIRQ